MEISKLDNAIYKVIIEIAKRRERENKFPHIVSVIEIMQQINEPNDKIISSLIKLTEKEFITNHPTIHGCSYSIKK